MMLLRAPLPDAAGIGMHDALRLALLPLDSEQPLHEVSAVPMASSAQMSYAGIEARCDRVEELPRMQSK